jgi:hypothetical protein
MKRTYLLFSIVVAIALLLAASGVGATDDCPPTIPSYGIPTPPRQCKINVTSDGTKNVIIVAGPNLGGGTDPLAKEFPIPVSCPEGQGFPTACLKWQYQFTFNNVNPEVAAVSVDSDITVFAATPSAEISRILGALNLGKGERFIKFNPSGQPLPLLAEYLTPVDATPGTLTAGFAGNYPIKLGKLTIPMPAGGLCALAGANNVVLQQNQATPDFSSSRIPNCLVTFLLDPSGKVVKGSMTAEPPDQCEVNEDESLKVIGDDGIARDVLFTTAAQTTQAGSCRYCWVNTAGGQSCTTCKTCCINKATNKCVPISSIPADQCKSGTF